jgi:hypothetical protein
MFFAPDGYRRNSRSVTLIGTYYTVHGGISQQESGMKGAVTLRGSLPLHDAQDHGAYAAWCLDMLRSPFPVAYPL